MSSATETVATSATNPVATSATKTVATSATEETPSHTPVATSATKTVAPPATEETPSLTPVATSATTTEETESLTTEETESLITEDGLYHTLIRPLFWTSDPTRDETKLCFGVYNIAPKIDKKPLEKDPNEEEMPLTIDVEVCISFEPSSPFGETPLPVNQTGKYHFPEKSMQVTFPTNSVIVSGTFCFSFSIGETRYELKIPFDENEDEPDSDSESESDSGYDSRYYFGCYSD